MARTWLLLDSNYLAYRALHTTGKLTHENVPTGVIYGFLRDVVNLQNHHVTNHIVFCFDHGESLRKVVYPGYKISRQQRRKEQTPEEKMIHDAMHQQLTLLREEYLEEFGYNNIHYQEGYEADDMIASICHNLKPKDKAIIVSADHDLFQLLNDQVICYNPAKQVAITAESFTEKFGVAPSQWCDVKAIAGCSSDDVIGVAGVGELTAAKWLAGRLKPGSKKFEAIVKGNKLWRKNLPIVRLPYVGTEVKPLYRDETTDEKWEGLVSRLGMKSLLREAPVAPKRRGFF